MSKKGINIEIEGFWLFLIAIMVVLPMFKMFFGFEDEDTDTGTKNTSVEIAVERGAMLDVENNVAIALINKSVKIPIIKNAKIVKRTPPDSDEQENIELKYRHVATSFDQTGTWTIDIYDKNNTLLDWIKVTVYE